MERIFINTENNKINESNKFFYQFTDKLTLKNPNNKNIRLVKLSIYYTWKNIISAFNNNQFKISAPTRHDDFYLPEGSYSISDIQDYFIIKIYFNFIIFYYLIIKKHESSHANLPNETKNRIVFKIKTGYKLELLSPETMKLLGTTKNVFDKDKDGEDVPKLELLKSF